MSAHTHRPARHDRPARTRWAAALLVSALGLATAGCATGGAAAEDPLAPAAEQVGGASAVGVAERAADHVDGRSRRRPAGQVARQVLQVSAPHEQTGMTLLEGPVFGPDGSLHVVDVTAPAGSAKVLRIDLDRREATPVLTQGNGAYTSAQISPFDGRLYLTDIVGGKIDSVELDGTDLRTVFSGPVDGTVMQPDDMAFDHEGTMYVSDTTGHDQPGGEPRGRIVRIERDGSAATVLAAGLPAPNGISFTPGFTGLLVSEYSANRIDHLGLTPDGTALTSAHPAVHVSPGDAQVDSTAVDAAGNVYQGLHRQARVLVFAPTGELLSTIEAPVPEGAAARGQYSATNIAIRPGTRDAYVTVSGPAGGFIHSFRALAGGTQQSNGG